MDSNILFVFLLFAEEKERTLVNSTVVFGPFRVLYKSL